MRFDRTAPLYKNAVTVSQIAKQIVVVTIVVVASFKGFKLLVEVVTGEDFQGIHDGLVSGVQADIVFINEALQTRAFGVDLLQFELEGFEGLIELTDFFAP